MERARLLDMVCQLPAKRLVVIKTPAGFGKRAACVVRPNESAVPPIATVERTLRFFGVSFSMGTVSTRSLVDGGLLARRLPSS
jgi:hypothetical protein